MDISLLKDFLPELIYSVFAIIAYFVGKPVIKSKLENDRFNKILNIADIVYNSVKEAKRRFADERNEKMSTETVRRLAASMAVEELRSAGIEPTLDVLRTVQKAFDARHATDKIGTDVESDTSILENKMKQKIAEAEKKGAEIVNDIKNSKETIEGFLK